MLGKLQSYRQAAGDKSVTEGCYSADKTTETISYRVQYVGPDLIFPSNHMQQASCSFLPPTCAQHTSQQESH